MRDVLRASALGLIFVLTGCQNGTDPQAVVAEESYGVISPRLPDGYPPKMGDVVAVVGNQQMALATYDFSIGAMDGSAAFRRSDVVNGVPVPQGQIDLGIVAYPAGNPDARAGRVIIEAIFPKGPAPGAIGQGVVIRVQQDADHNGKMLYGTDGTLKLDQYDRPGDESYGRMSGIVSGSVCDAVAQKPVSGGKCLSFSARFDTAVQFDYSAQR